MIFPTSKQSYDSRPSTIQHINRVQKLMFHLLEQLNSRANKHDQSKLYPPELDLFDQYTPLLSTLTYGTDEYRQALRELKPALDHHYAHNTHHPEFYPEGIKGMNLLDLLEMICDWKAASERVQDGDLCLSVTTINQERFGYSDELKEILLNTIDLLEGV